MNADVFPDYAANTDVDWTVEDNGTGTTIDSTGLLQANPTAAGDGTVRVKATAKDGSGVFDTVDVVITNQNAAFVEFINISHDGDFPEIIENKGTLQFYAEVLPGNASNKTVNWTVKDNGTGASIDQTGLLAAYGSTNGNGTVTVYATATDGSGIVDSMDVVIMGQVASINDVRASKAVSVYPNPVNEGHTLNIVISDNAYSIEAIGIYQYTGKKIASYDGFSVGTRQADISIEGMAGIYLLRIETNKGTVIKRIMKTR